MHGLLALGLGVGGCGDDGTGGGATSGGTFTGPLYAIQTIEYSADLSSRTGLVHFASSLDAESGIDESKTIELTTVSSQIFNSTQTGEIFIADAGTGQIVKYALGGDGRVAEAAKVSFAAYGVTAFEFPMLAVASSEKAYMIDNATLQSFVWDPSQMTIQKNGNLASAINNVEGGKAFTVFFERSLQKVGKKLVGAYTYFDPITLEMPARSGVVLIDTETDDFKVVEHPSCGGLGNTVIGPDGLAYVASMNSAAAIYRAGIGAPPCIVRLDPETGAFDDTYKVDVPTLVGTAAGGLAEYQGSSAWIWGLDESLLPPGTPTTSAVALVSSTAWTAYRIDDITNPTAAMKVDSPPLGFVVTIMRSDGRAYFPRANLQDNETRLMDASTDPPSPAIRTKGWIQYTVRVQ